MMEQGHRMQHLIEDMLTLSRLESVDHPMRPEHVDIRKMMEQVLRDCARAVGRQARVSRWVNGGDVMGAYEELHSAFGNLASNAVRYTPAGGKIHLAGKSTDKGVKFVVRIPASASALSISRG
jgi:two-component system phosphate regulon sensor histidine kinase PhoR